MEWIGETIDEQPATDWPAIHKACMKHQRFVVEVRKYDEKREVTLKQYAYFYGVVIPVLTEAMSCSRWEAEFWCKHECGKEWELIKKVGPDMWVECSKTKLDVQQFNRCVKGGVKVQRLADQNCDTPDLPTPPETGCQFVSVHLSYASPGADGFGSGEGSSLLLASAFRSRRFD